MYAPRKGKDRKSGDPISGGCSLSCGFNQKLADLGLNQPWVNCIKTWFQV